VNTAGITKDQHEAMSLLVRNGRNGPSATGLSVHTYRALVRRGLLHHTGGRGNSSMYAVTDDGRQWANEFI
jgi:hypothetical protein